MSNEATSEQESVGTETSVSLPVDTYNALVNRVKSSETKLKALNNLNLIIQSKDQELKASLEKSHNLQTALDKAEMRLANQIRLIANGSNLSNLTSSVQNISAKTDVPIMQSGALGTSNMKLHSNGNKEAEISALYSSDLESDCALVAEPSLHIQTLSPQCSSVQMKDCTSSCRMPSLSPHFVKDPSISQGRGFSMELPSLSSVNKMNSLGTPGHFEKCSLTESHSVKNVGVTGVSKDLLDKLMQQNARLKKVVRDILNQRGASLDCYLDKQEYEDVVKQLKDDLRLSKAHNEKLKEIINTKDSDDLSKKYSELLENFSKLKRTATMTQAMADSYSKEYEKLKQENKELKDQLSAVSDKQRLSSSRKEFDRETSLKDSVDNFPSNVFGMPKTKPDDVHGEKISDLEADNTSLRRLIQQQSEIAKSKMAETEGLREELSKTVQQCKNLDSDNQLLQSQIKLFKDDFALEQKETREKQQNLETTIAKHQEWIRKLVGEAQKSRALYDEEKSKRAMAETRLQELLSQNRTMSNCRSVENLLMPWNKSPFYGEDLQVDTGNCPPSVSDETKAQGKDPLVCPRCEREFEKKDQQKWKDHCAKCRDD